MDMDNEGMKVKGSIFKRPQWSLTSSFLAALAIFCVVTTVILVVVKKSVWVELEIVALALTPIMFLYMLAVLYQGVKFDKREKFVIDWTWIRKADATNFIDGMSFADIGFPFTELGSGEGCLGAVVGFIIDIIVSMFLMALIGFVLWFAINALPEAIIIVCLPLFYFYRRSLRYLVANGRACKGHWGKSVQHALLSSVIYSTWFYLIVYVGHYVSRQLRDTHQ